MIIATRSNGIYSSPRIEKYVEFYRQQKLNYEIVGWDRNNEGLSRENTIYFCNKSGYNTGGYKAVIGRIKWMFFLMRQFIANKKQLNTIHAFDLDTAFPAMVFKRFFKRDIVVIFDVCDWFSANLYNANFLIRRIFSRMEAYCIKYTNYLILCEPERKAQIPFPIKCPIWIVPNIPSFNDTSFLHIDERYQFHNNKITVSYVGGFGDERFIDELLDVAQQGIINLLIAGFGNKHIVDRCLNLNSLENIRCFGKVKYSDGLNIMYNSDAIYAMYCTSNPNNVFAAPNKYYECMMLGKPIITTKGTIMESKVERNNIGYTIIESKEQLITLLCTITKQDCAILGSNANCLWKNQYVSYLSEFQTTVYLNTVK